ncbi:hypothetical protein [Desulfosporosinus sp. SB140]|uniref:hypothetical protein n=1 Tax=Desulfosporosinus paludis TaxID=3115649 RepID=UPI00388D410D
MRNQLLKAERIRHEIEAYQDRKKFSKFMCISNSVRTDEKVSEVIVDYMDTRRISQRGVNPNIIRPFGLRRE